MRFARILFLIAGIHIAAGAENRGRLLVSKKKTRHLQQCSSWETIGKDLTVNEKGDEAGWSVSMSTDGTVVAFGADGNDDGGIDSGRVLVFAWDDEKEDWMMRGDPILGLAKGDLSGLAVSMSEDGTVLAVGAPKNSDSKGHVRVFVWNPLTKKWIQRGVDIIGSFAGDQSGDSVSMSRDGTVVAIGAEGSDGIYINSGLVRVWKWNSVSNSWIQRGSNINGEAKNDSSGVVAISHDGEVVAVGAVYNDGNGKDSGHVRVWKWNSISETWVQRGNDIDGETTEDGFGWSLDISDDGSVLAIGAVWNDNGGNNSGSVQFLKWDSGRWLKEGKFVGKANDQLGLSVSLSGDGTRAAIGAPDKCDNSGHSIVRIYERAVESNTWEKRERIRAKGGAQFGASVSMSGNGIMVAIGAPYYDELSGYVRVMKLEEKTCPCKDSPLVIEVELPNKTKKDKDCDWVKRWSTNIRCALPGIRNSCPLTCESCSVCADSTLKLNITKGNKKIKKTCDWVKRRDSKRAKRCAYFGVSDTCRKACNNCIS